MSIRWKVALIEDDRRLVRAVSAGLDEEIAKPFALEELVARVEAVIRRHRGDPGSATQAKPHQRGSLN